MINRKNICYIISGDQWAGAEVQSFYLIKEITEKSVYNVSVILFNEGLLAQRLRKLDLDISIVDEKINTFFMVMKIYQIFKKNKFDVIHTHGYKENFIGGIAAKLCGIRNLVRTHHGIAMIGKDKTMNYLIEVINERLLTAKTIAVSNDLKKYLIRKSFNDQKITVIHNGIPPRFDPSSMREKTMEEKDKTKSNNIIIGTVGRLVHIKGHIYLIDGIDQIVEKYKNISVMIIGEGPLEAELRITVEKKGLIEYIKFIGFCDNVEGHLRLMDIFVLPSLHEGIPMVLLEAMQHRKAIVASEIGGIPEVISNGFNGLLVPTQNATAISDACLNLIKDKTLRDKLGNNAYKTVNEQFSITRTVEKTVDCYNVR